MTTPTTCTCTTTEDMSWHPAPCDEAGWECNRCGHKAPGEPPGYRPDLDVALLAIKVENILMDLTMADLVYMSNSTDGDCCTAQVVNACKASGHYDQYSIIAAIMGYANATHAAFWKERGDAVREGRDARDRCVCGQLATGGPIGGPSKCGDCRVDGWFGLLAAEPRDPSEPDPPEPWAVFGEWLDGWRDDHPDDGRSDLDLIEVYANAPAEDVEAAGERARREGGPA